MAIPVWDDPIEHFKAWYAEAQETDLREPTAVCLATAGADGQPTARMVLLKQVGQRGFAFYTNTASLKGDQLRENPKAALCFHWQPLGRQVQVHGTAEPVTEEEADAYFASRDRRSRIGAWASKQSAPLASRFHLEKRVARFLLRFGVGEIPRPAWWSGYRVKPYRIEFWHERPFRLHDRLEYVRNAAGTWTTQTLFP
jgi:pyridoxamine 5'-phosphate oxidase